VRFWLALTPDRWSFPMLVSQVIPTVCASPQAGIAKCHFAGGA
jgi:hypothetical protein